MKRVIRKIINKVYFYTLGSLQRKWMRDPEYYLVIDREVYESIRDDNYKDVLFYLGRKFRYYLYDNYNLSPEEVEELTNILLFHGYINYDNHNIMIVKDDTNKKYH